MELKPFAAIKFSRLQNSMCPVSLDAQMTTITEDLEEKMLEMEGEIEPNEDIEESD